MQNEWRKKIYTKLDKEENRVKNDEESKHAEGVSMAWNSDDKNTKSNGNDVKGRFINSIIKKV